MSQPLSEERTCPEHEANIFSRLLYLWINPIISLGYKRPLELDDLYVIKGRYAVAVLTEQFQKNWKNEQEKNPQKPSLVRAISATFGLRFYLAGILKLISDTATIVTPFILRLLLQDLGNLNEVPAWRPFFYCAMMFFLGVLGTFCVNTYFQIVMLIGFSVRTVLNTAIYKKSLYLSNLSRQKFSNGQIVNMMSTDSARLDVIAGYLHYMWSGPVQVVAIMGLLVNFLGPSAWAGFGFLVILFPIQGFLMSWLAKIRKRNSAITDQRVRLTQEILNGIRVIKFYAWENSFLKRLMGLRDKEIGLIRMLSYARAAVNAIITSVPIFSGIISFVVYAAINGSEGLKAEIIFPAFTLINLLRLPMILFPMIVAQYVDAKVAIGRIQEYLLGEEVSFKPILDTTAELAIETENATFKWENLPSKAPEEGKSKEAPPSPVSTEEASNSKATPFKLHPFSVKIKKGDLVAVVGSVGSGKSSLLSALLGEMTHESGVVKFGGTVGYCPQQAWIQNLTLKNNVTFGRDFDAAKYRKVIKYCALEPDLKILPAGDETEIGEKGINLSGGQKQRVSLARAVYYDAEIIFLDDPLSAVDSHVGKFIFEECICGLLKDKTRVLVTHQLHVLPKVDYIYFMENGQVKEHGTYEQLMKDKSSFSVLMSKYGGVEEEESVEDPYIPAESDPSKIVESNTTEGIRSSIRKSVKSSVKGENPRQGLMTVEERAMGAVNWPTYWEYLKACGGYIFVTLIVVCAFLSQGSKLVNDYWLTFWTGNRFGLANQTYMLVYGLLGLLQTLVAFFFALVVVLGGLNAACHFHNEAFKKVLFSPISFFDTTPLGRIINRFSKDMDSVDNSISDSFRMFLLTFAGCLGTLTLICIVTPYFLIPLFPLIILYYFAQKYYRSTSRELKRLDSLSRSPLYAHLGETLNGIITIRAYREEERFIRTNETFVCRNNRPYFLQISIQRWLAVRLETIGNFIVLFASLIAVLLKVSDGEAGLSIGYALSVTGILNWCVRQLAEVEIQMNAVERLHHYISNLNTESEIGNGDEKMSSEWPSEGSIRISDLTLKYRPELPPVLRSVSFTVKSREKIGVVGRTGAGKSSIMIALFRIVEAAEGSIHIDGIDISKVALPKLRSKLSIIPQDPILYSGTIRSNLDPFLEYQDDNLWEVLERSYLKTYVSGLELKLDAPVAENGSNLSVGQRQLLCLARAMLRRSKILVMDEATANIDVQTDSLIQSAIRKDFSYCTILTIAHRLNTVVDYDKILVLDQGKLVEYDEPHILLSNSASHLSLMVDETGPKNASLLRSIAAKRYSEIRQSQKI